jgi:hypothetical protein
MRADDPDAWSRHMRIGNFDAAWRICDRAAAERRGQTCFDLPRHQQWVWDGSAIDDRDVLVRCYHGLGDTIQFARYLPMLRARARSVVVWAQPRLIPLLATTHACDRLLPLNDGNVGIDYDVDVEIMELAHVFRTSVDTIPAATPYFSVKPLPLRHGSRRAVGLVWKAGDWDDERSVPFEHLGPLLDIDVDWYVLQGGSALADKPPAFGTVVGADDIMEAAAAMRGLDLLITIDSMPAHLGGALGTHVWTLLPYHADWRWMDCRDDSPWYPTMRLFRQPAAGSWPAVMARVSAELRAIVTELGRLWPHLTAE